ncbi:MAG: response regulator [Planctomycetes bacterium]|nr:response regulator [Planctomycetota bacterium]
MEHVIKLLIVDDETQFLEAIAKRLRKRGLEVHTAASGAEAIEIAGREQFDIALLDLKMPGMDGSQVLKELKQRHKHLEAVILTGHGSLESAVELTKLGAFGYLPKPYELEKLVDTLKAAYEVRLKKKFAADERKLKEIMRLGTSESAIGILRRLKELDDEER